MGLKSGDIFVKSFCEKNYYIYIYIIYIIYILYIYNIIYIIYIYI